MYCIENMTIANQIISFKLSGINYIGTSTQLNYTAGVIAGTALASKALVLDSNKNLTGITTLTIDNLIASSSISGNIVTANQPNITQLGTLNSLNVNGVLNLPQHNGVSNGLQLNGTLVTSSATELNFLSGASQGSAVAGKALVVNSGRNIGNINTITCSAISVGSTISINNVAITASASEINYVRTSPGVVEENKAVVVDSSKNITGFNSITSNTIVSSNMSGTISTANQPNITQLGTLTSLNLNGSISGAVNISLTGNISGAVSVSATNLSGTIATPAQPNITSLGTITNLTVGGRMTTTNATINSLTLGSTIVNATGDELNNLAGATPGTASNNKCLVVNGSRDIVNINSLTTNTLISNNLSGTINTASQPNITQVGALNNLDISGLEHVRFQNNTSNFSSYAQWTNNITTPLSARIEISNESFRLGSTSNHTFRFMTNNSTVMSIENTGNVNIGSTVPTSFRLNVNGSANVNSLSLGGTSVSATATELNYVAGSTPGTAVPGKALVVNNNRNITNIADISCATLTSTSISGTIGTGSQPNITQVGTLSSLTVESNGVGTIIRNLTSNSATGIRFTNDIRNIDIGIRGSGSGTTPDCFYISDSAGTRFVLDNNGNFTMGSSITSSFRLNVAGGLNATNISIGGGLISASSTEINYLTGVTLGTASNNRVLTTNSDRDVGNIRNLSAVNISGIMTTNAQPNITQLGTLTSLTMSGSVEGVVNINMSGNIIGASVINATTLAGTLSTAIQPNITQLGTLNNIVSNGNIKVGTVASNAVDMIHIEGNNTDGLGLQIENRNITSDSSSYIKFTGFSNTNTDYDLARVYCGYVPVNSNFGYGYLAFSTRNNSSSLTASERMRITENGNVGVGKTAPLYNMDVAGTINCDSVRIGGELVSASASELNKIAGITNGTASVNKALIVDANRNIGNLNTVTASSFSGTITTSSQPNITSLGLITNLNATNLSATNITGTIVTSTQPNITSLGTLNTLNATTANITNVNATNISGTINTSAQPNITSIGVVSSNMRFGSSVRIGMNNQASPVAAIDMGSTINDRALAIFNNTSSYYGIGANSSQLRYFSAAAHSWYTNTTASSLGSSIMDLSSSGQLTVSSINASGTSDDCIFMTNTSSGGRASLKMNVSGRSVEFGLRSTQLQSDFGFYIYDNVAGAFRMAIYNNGRVGIGGGITSEANSAFGRGTVYPDVKLAIATEVNFALYVDNGQISFPQAAQTRSDYRIKTDVELLDKGLKEILNLRPVKYKLPTDKIRKYIGFIAHEAQQHIPEIVYGEKDAKYPDGNMKLQSVAYESLTPILTKAVQEQHQLINTNSQSIDLLVEKNKKMEMEIEQLKKTVAELLQKK